MPSVPNETPTEARRSFLASLSALMVGAVASVVPIAVGVTALLDPLRRSQATSSAVHVTQLAALPSDGVPRKFTIETKRVDAWTTFDNVPVGAVYLRRSSEGISALNVVCPHAGCFVGLAPDRAGFACPCHKSSFDLEGAVNDPGSPSPRAMDALQIEVRNGDEIWVHFQNFLSGREDKTPV